ncbi:uncharacterized protein [Gossypium hirsutum]|uniref:Integrase zinc-binding domain-containing protein n=1 Tax=Gossypium hirsutum TaxID=3635 RepID=A0A1U8P7C4_GOSHI|nr:uncharacterized protein LOC107955843 [Gossypium hirsutum]
MDFGLNIDGVLYFRGQICVPNDIDLREAHSSPYATHPCGNKMYRDLRELYWWPGLKREVTDFMAQCLTYQQVKAELQLPSVLGTKLVSETEDKVRLIRDNLKAASDRQKSCVDLKRHDIEYSVGDFVFLKLSPELDRIHNVFHVLMLRRYSSDPTHMVPVEEIEVLWRNHNTEEATWEPEDLMHQ